MQSDSEQVLAMLDEALALTDRIQTAYCRANPTQRRLFNQALFAAIWIDNEDVACSQLAVPFDDLLPRTCWPRRCGSPGRPSPSTAQHCRSGSIPKVMLGKSRAGNGSRVLAAVGASPPDNQTGDPFTKVAGSNVGRMVELGGSNH